MHNFLVVQGRKEKQSKQRSQTSIIKRYLLEFAIPFEGGVAKYLLDESFISSLQLKLQRFEFFNSNFAYC